MRSGRKKAALAYVLTYTVGCVTKHFNNFGVLLVGRLFCGVATSLLNSAFESWLVAEHSKVEIFPCGACNLQVKGERREGRERGVYPAARGQDG
jgi:hypothetical protein